MPNLNLTSPLQDQYYSSASYTPIKSAPQSVFPSTMLYASMGLSSLGNLLDTFSQVSALRTKGAYEASIARTNSTIARLQAKQVLEAGNTEAQAKNLETRGKVGTVRAIQGASGIDVNSVSSRLVRNAYRGAGAIDELTIKNNAARKAWGLEVDAMESTFKGEFAETTANNEAKQTILSGGLRTLSGPLDIYRRSGAYGAGGATRRLPFDMEG